ncbi:glycosyltransferase family 4 protein [Halorubrum sp. DTA46]|uniref:glycosyltransferase family 4 protein n=1 Tax=Halorubrum sp. DTA46 TaxID=3402162 RepID=UPI003AB0013F
MSDSSDITAVVMSAERYPENPYMQLLTSALAEQGVTVEAPDIPVFLPLIRTAFRYPEADLLHLDWLYEYYVTSEAGYQPVDAALTVLRTLTFLLDLLLVALHPIGVVWTVHNKRHHEGKYPRLERAVNELLFLTADAVTVKCSAAGDDLASLYRVPSPDRFDVVPDGSYVSAYENDIGTDEARDELAIPEDTFVYLFFGLVREYKGLPELIDAFGRLDADDAELWIVGNPHNERLRARLKAQADATGNVETVFAFVPEDRVQYYMNACDVFVLPYRDILNSGSAYLGLSYGKPIVAPAIGCLPATLPTSNPFVYDPNASDALKTALQEAYDHPDLASIGRSNLEHARRQDWESAAAALVDVYRDV